MALLLRRRGITRVRPLEGGLDAWREQGYPLDPDAVGNLASALAPTAATKGAEK